MTIEDEEDLPYGENFHDEGEAAAWAEAAAQKRPWRPMIFDHFAAAVMGAKVPGPRILELGSGPGFLAEHVLDRCGSVSRYTLLDFSEAMLAQSRRRLECHRARSPCRESTSPRRLSRRPRSPRSVATPRSTSRRARLLPPSAAPDRALPALRRPKTLRPRDVRFSSPRRRPARPCRPNDRRIRRSRTRAHDRLARPNSQPPLPAPPTPCRSPRT